MAKWLARPRFDLPDRSGAGLLGLGFSSANRSIRLGFAFAVHPEKLDWIFALVNEEYIEWVSIGFRGGHGFDLVRMPVQCEEGADTGFDQRRKGFRHMGAKFSEFRNVLGLRSQVGPFVGVFFNLVKLFVTIGIVDVAPVPSADAAVAGCAKVRDCHVLPFCVGIPE